MSYKIIQKEIINLQTQIQEYYYQIDLLKDILNKKNDQLKYCCPHNFHKTYTTENETYVYCNDCSTYLYKNQDYGMKILN